MFKVRDKPNKMPMQISFKILSCILTAREDHINKANLDYKMSCINLIILLWNQFLRLTINR
jgi:hypothetical protein